MNNIPTVIGFNMHKNPAPARVKPELYLEFSGGAVSVPEHLSDRIDARKLDWMEVWEGDRYRGAVVPDYTMSRGYEFVEGIGPVYVRLGNKKAPG